MSKQETKKESPSQPFNIWMFTTVLAAIAFLAVLTLYALSPAPAPQGTVVPVQECGNRMVQYINENLVSAGTSATLVSAVESNGLYEVTTRYQDRDIAVYASRDCMLLFPQYVDITEPVETPTPTPTPTIIKTEIPTVDLYVMAFCPYGVQAENAMKPVVDLLGGTAEITVRFISSVQGDTISSVQSLHGIEEAKEDARQVCIMEQYPQNYWAYLMKINSNCYPLYRNSTEMEACWKDAATKLGMDTGTIETCAYGAQGLGLLAADESLTDQYGVTGSPTLIINGARYQGARTSDGFKQAICNAFVTAPVECSVGLSTNTTAASGQC